ncbi:MAG: PKD domain-containing protein [Candidatus Cloacimonadaceae bacterium]|nr:PKD domain-containing protein [Candidatus Cloacimonadaceae bacterium]
MPLNMTAYGDPTEVVIITDISFSGSQYFSIETALATPFPMWGNDSITMSVIFRPGSVGDHSGWLIVTDDTRYQHHIYLEGYGAAPPLAVYPASYDFGTTIQPSETGSVFVDCYRDPGSTVGAYLISAVLSGDSSFALSPNMTNAIGMPVATLPYYIHDADVLIFEVIFSPTNYLTQNAVLTLTDEYSNTYTTTLVAYEGAVGGDFAWIVVTPNPLPLTVLFGGQAIAGFQVNNNGNIPLYYDIDPASIPTYYSITPVNGIVAAGQSITHTLVANAAGLDAGFYSNNIVINNNDATQPVYLYNINMIVSPPLFTVDFIANPLIGHAPLNVMFLDQSTTDPNMTSTHITGWRWDFNNDGIIDSYLQNPLYTYAQPGIYTVKLTVITNNGQYASETKQNFITATNQAPIIHNPLNEISNMFEDIPWGPSLLSDYFSDPDLDPLTYSTQNSPHISVFINQHISFTLYSAQDWFGTETIVIIATDPFGASVSMTVTITVLPVNDAPVLNVPADFHFIRNSTFVVDFAPYINDPDNPHAELSIMIERIIGQGNILYAYRPINVPNVLGQFSVAFTSPMQIPMVETFRISVNDNMGRLISQAQFRMNLLDHFEVQFSATGTTTAIIAFAGQTINFKDDTLGNPDWWSWEFIKLGVVVATSTVKNPSMTLNESGAYTVRLHLGNDEANEQAFHQIFNMFNLQGTAVLPGFIPLTWNPPGSPYNIYDPITISLDQTIEIQNNVVVNIFTGSPLTIMGTLNAFGVRFQPQSAGGRWHGFRFQGGGRPIASQFTNCDIVDALEPFVIEDSSPLLQSINIAVTDTTEIIQGTAIKLSGNSAPEIDDLDIANYRIGIDIEPSDNDRTTPVLTNIRVRNSTDTSRTDPTGSIGFWIKGDVEIEDAEIENFGTGILFEGTETNRTSTPTLTNIRVRNSTDTSRSATYGIIIRGDIVPSMEEVTIEETNFGIKMTGGNNPPRTTPELTNIRVRNSTDTSRSANSGVILENMPSVQIDNMEVDGFSPGIVIRSDTRTLSTPVLTNIRVRNSTDTSRTEDVGLLINGAVALSLIGAEIDDFHYGIKYQAAPLRATSTPVLTNIRVRNSTDTSRQSSIGIQLIDLSRVIMHNDSIVGYNVGLQITTGGMRELSTPVLTNIRVRNSTDTSRTSNVGIFLGAGVGGFLEGADVSKARIGILIADGNRTMLKPNVIRNCEVGIRAAGILPLAIRRQLIVLDLWFALENPLWNFSGMELNMPGPWLIENNTIQGYPKGLKANQAGIIFRNNIAWDWSPIQIPFELVNSVLTVSHSDIAFAQGVFPGVGNLRVDPQYADVLVGDYRLSYNSPLIDAGSPLVPRDADGSISDIGAFTYLHRAGMVSSHRFIQTGNTVNFTNTSIGHDHPVTLIQWDLGNDEIIDGITRDWSYQFNTPGVYALRLKMITGNLVDERIYLAAVVVQEHLLQPPQNLRIERQGNHLLLDWDAVEFTQEQQPIAVEYYIVYSSPTPDGYFDYVAFTQNYATSFMHNYGASQDRGFYIILGFAGTRTALNSFIEANPRYHVPGDNEGGGPRRKK